MTPPPKMRGVIAPLLTPFNDNLSVAADLYAEHAHNLLARGMHYLAPFGTTGEALSLSASERMQALDALIDSGIAPESLMPGAGLCNLEDTRALVQHAASRGCTACMLLPPFFYKAADDDGLYAYFAQLLESVRGVNICLYHIPPMVGIGFSPELTARLARDFSEVIAYKDSGGDFAHTQAVIRAAPDIAVFPGAETFLQEGLAQGAAGCISATCNINPSNIRRVYDLITRAETGDTAHANNAMVAFRKAVERQPMIAAMKAVLAVKHDQPRWRHVRPPLLPFDAAQAAKLMHEWGKAGERSP